MSFQRAEPWGGATVKKLPLEEEAERKGSDIGSDQGSRGSWKPKEKILNWEILKCKCNG